MSKLSELQGKPQKFKIGDTELELKPLTVAELELFNISENAPVEQQMESAKNLITKVLKNSIPDATDEEIANVSLEHLNDLMEAIMKLHKMDKKGGVPQAIKDVQERAKARRN